MEDAIPHGLSPGAKSLKRQFGVELFLILCTDDFIEIVAS